MRTPDADDREVMIRSALQFASLDSFHQGRNDYVRAPLSRNRFMMGIEISLSSESERRSNRLNEDAQYVALTDHDRRRSTPQ